jgi:hypothetical protein
MAFFGNWFKANRKKEQEDAYNEAMEQLRIQDEAQRQAAIERRKWYEDIVVEEILPDEVRIELTVDYLDAGDGIYLKFHEIERIYKEMLAMKDMANE